MAPPDSASPPLGTIAHDELCFGCGQANLFGLQLEAEDEGQGRFGGRFFLKQDHQGPPGAAHRGVVAAAIQEAMALAVRSSGIQAACRRFELDLAGEAALGTFLHVEAGIEEREGGEVRVGAAAFGVSPDGSGESSAAASGTNRAQGHDGPSAATGERRQLARAKGVFLESGLSASF